MSGTKSYRYIGNFSAVDPPYSVLLTCEQCEVRWIGCWDGFECPECGIGELPGQSELLAELLAENKQ